MVTVAQAPVFKNCREALCSLMQCVSCICFVGYECHLVNEGQLKKAMNILR